MSCDTKNVNKFQIFLGMYNYREKNKETSAILCPIHLETHVKGYILSIIAQTLFF